VRGVEVVQDLDEAAIKAAVLSVLAGHRGVGFASWAVKWLRPVPPSQSAG
jgi:hypothetical protein